MSTPPTADVRLRPVEDADLPTLFDHQTDPAATEMAVFEAKARPEFMAHWAAIAAEPTAIARAIVAEGVVVGHVGCWVEGDHRAVGYWIGRAFWGRGYASRALALLLEEVPDRPLIAHVVDTNIGSQRVLEKCGFERIGGAEVDGITEWTYRLD